MKNTLIILGLLLGTSCAALNAEIEPIEAQNGYIILKHKKFKSFAFIPYKTTKEYIVMSTEDEYERLADSIGDDFFNNFEKK